MAAEIHSRPQSSRPVLLSKIEGHQDTVTAALLIPKEDGVITASEDRTIRVWLKRDSGQYWPSIYHTMASPCSAMAYHHESRRIFVGQDNGAVMYFGHVSCFVEVNFDTFQSHQNRVSAIIFSVAVEWVISTGHDKCVSWMCTRSGSMLGRHFFTSWASCLQYDFDTQYAFVGDYSGQITLLKLEQSACSVITTLKGHEGSIVCLWWDPIQRLLFSGASDNSIIMWDIGGRKGRTLLLQGHQCAPQWLESDSCQKCEQPFFWNIKQMWDTKTLGLRQHHCRKCGQAVCGKCSSKRSSYPIMGFEFQVRVCDSCYDSIKDEDRTSLATFHEGKHNISHMSMDVARGLMVTCGTDRIVKIWDMTPVVGCSLATGFSPH
ncbi:WD repeat and FYVE domain-containing protein 1 [Orycteropus afer afer]|uniref:WD repeat and FYVE domain-containing protein 1 n=1 Tax=Orycteropus afer afer TaxID=1230840 RepID=A0A8B6ZDN5_ORYAF|nr:WD repeat and FYVE domain-containing protein 1 [Orycteropus afer afer]